MWKSDAQACEAITELLRSVRLERLWTPTGPTQEAVDWIDADGGPLSSGEMLMLRVAFDFWNGQGHADFGRMLHVFDDTRFQRVCELATALAQGEVDQWLRARAAIRAAMPWRCM